MLKKFTLTTLGIIIVAGAIIGTKIAQFKAMAAAGASMVPPPETVTAAEVSRQAWENRIAVTGSLVAVQGVTVGAEVAGKVVKLSFAFWTGPLDQRERAQWQGTGATISARCSRIFTMKWRPRR